MGNFNLDKFIKSSFRLLGTNSQKYESKDTLLMNNQQEIKQELLKQQRTSLYMKLGIDVGGAAKLDTSHIFSDYDLISAAQNNELVPESAEGISSSSSKRKEFDEDDSVGSNLDTQNKKIKVEINQDENEQDNDPYGYIKSLDTFITWLIGKLFEPEWEIRHGAATSLREILKKLVQSLFNFNQNQGSSSLNLDWFEWCLCELFRVLALDRFADYVGDEVVAPVRETCTQIIGIISKLFTLNSENTLRLCDLINKFLFKLDQKNWEIRHSGIMILKYTIGAALASRTSTLKEIFALTYDNVLECLKDNDDDVRLMASSSLEPVSMRLNELLDHDHEKLQRLIRILIDVLSELDDLGKKILNFLD